MIDFLMISTRSTKRGVIEIYPKFIIKKSSDLMIRGGDFYAIWLEDRGLWSTDEQDALQLIDRELDRYAEENRKNFDSSVKVLHMWDSESGMIDSWHKYCQKQMRDSFHMLDEKLIFSNTPTNKKDYASKKLKYPLEEGTINAYDKLMSTLYSETEREKIEWAIGSIVCGDSKKLQKFMVLYGATGTGKSTVLNIIQQLFDGYYSVFDAMDDQGESDPESEDNNDDDSKGGTNTMKHNVFDKDDRQKENVLVHSDGSEVSSEEISTIFGDIKRYGSLKDSVLAHGIDNVDYLFPDAQTLANTPEFIQRDTGWVKKVMSGVHHTPFSRIKSIFADITEDDARAKGYFKGKLKKEEVFGLLKRTTTPTTVYKKQKMDRDDVVDITDFDVVAWLKSEMRMMLDEELARAYLIGDGRLASSDDKINEQNIRPILKDEELYTIQATVSVQSSATEDDKAREFIRTAIKARKNYKGSGQPTLYTTEDILTDCLLLTDTTGRDLYTDVAQLAKKLRVKEIVTVPVMEGVNGKNGGALMGIIVNLADYNVGADRGGAVNMFDDFDIDYNQQKYLIETRCSGALIKPYSAIALELSTAG